MATSKDAIASGWETKVKRNAADLLEAARGLQNIPNPLLQISHLFQFVSYSENANNQRMMQSFRISNHFPKIKTPKQRDRLGVVWRRERDSNPCVMSFFYS